jgi:hypothetical protein
VWLFQTYFLCRDGCSTQNFTYFNLIEIFPFKGTYTVLVQLPGAVVAAAVKFSRTLGAYKDRKFSTSLASVHVVKDSGLCLQRCSFSALHAD